MTGIRELYPFGDLDQSVIERAAESLPPDTIAQVAAGLSLAARAVDLLEAMPAPLREAGLSPARWRLLVALRFQSGDGGATAGELAAHLGVREPTVTASVSRAERDGHVLRHRDEADRRIVRVRLTATGHEIVTSLIPVMIRRVASVVAACGGLDAVHDMTGRLAGGAEVDTDLAASPV